MRGYLRADGRKGIRNVLAVVYLVECAHHVAAEIARPYRDRQVHLVGFPGCYPNAYALRILERIVTHPNVGAVLLVSLGCESFDRERLFQVARESKRPTELLIIQEVGGTTAAIDKGKQWVERTMPVLEQMQRVPMDVRELTVGTICGGSDATSGLTANPAVGRVFDMLIDQGATCIFEEAGELVGCEKLLAQRAITPQLAEELLRCMEKTIRCYTELGHGSFAPGNADGGLTTIEEKSLGAYCKSGSRPISGLIKPGEVPPAPGLYMMDVVSDGPLRFGFPNIVDSAEVVELIACGSHLILFTTGVGSVVGSAVSPVIKVCANPATFERLKDDMDVNAGRILRREATIEDVAQEIYQLILQVADGRPTASERLLHQEFILGYKYFEPSPPHCFAAQTH